MAIKVSLVNMKGGVGKSTLAVNLAWVFADAIDGWAVEVLLVDLDPQFNASQYMLGYHRYRTKILAANAPTVQNIFEGGDTPLDYNPVIHNVYAEYHYRMDHGAELYGRLDLIPSRLELAYVLRQPEQKEYLLAEFISKVENRYDLIFFDCPPTESLLTTAAYLASDYVLVPVKPEFLSSIGLPLLGRSMEDFREKFSDKDLRLAGIVFNTATEYMPEEMQTKQWVHEMAKPRGWYVFKNEIGYSRSYAKGAREGQPIFRTSYARWDRKETFRAFACELQDRIGL